MVLRSALGARKNFAREMKKKPTAIMVFYIKLRHLMKVEINVFVTSKAVKANLKTGDSKTIV